MITTERLIVRDWCDADRAPFAAMVADPDVMRYLGPLQDRASADAGIDRSIAHQAAHGFAFWAVERRDDGDLLGFCGLKRVALAGTPIDGTVEIGWRLRRDAWGRGFAREAAAAVLDWAWQNGQAEVLAMTSPANTRSWALIERLGMTRRDDLAFDHPVLGADDPLRLHIVYSIARLG